MSHTVPTWDEFAWTSFLYGALGGDESYQSLMKKTTFLTTLRNKPNNLSEQDIGTELLAGFLNTPAVTHINQNHADKFSNIENFCVASPAHRSSNSR